MRKPFWRKAYQCWYVKDAAGSFIRLDPDKSRAEDIWEEMIAAGCARGRLATVLGITEAFLAEHEPMMSEASFYSVANYVLAFADSMGSGMLVSKITKGRLVAWLKESKPGRLLKNKDPDDKTERRGPAKVWSLHGQRDAGRTDGNRTQNN